MSHLREVLKMHLDLKAGRKKSEAAFEALIGSIVADAQKDIALAERVLAGEVPSELYEPEVPSDAK